MTMLVIDVAVSELMRAISGRLFTNDQISALTKGALGKYFAEFLPEPQDERTARERVEEARVHIVRASSIIAQMQEELSQQSAQLDKLLVEVEQKKQLAEQYGQLATMNQKQSAALRSELEEVLRKELLAQAEKGRRLRQIVSAAGWLVTLILGAWLGTYFKDVAAWLLEAAKILARIGQLDRRDPFAHLRERMKRFKFQTHSSSRF